MRRRWTVVILIAVVAVGGWAAFRPERLWVDKTVNESLGTTDPGVGAAAAAGTGSPQLLSSGTFHDGAHATSGMAAVYSLGQDRRVLRLTQFSTSNGPDVHVYLVAASDATDNDTVKNVGFVDLGSIKGNIGDQNYDLPADVDLTKYRAVTIWCRRFGVNFGTSPLSAPQS
jgi:hypothetical protein